MRREEVRRKPEKQVRARPPGPCPGAALPQVGRGSRPRLDPTFQAGLGPVPSGASNGQIHPRFPARLPTCFPDSQARASGPGSGLGRRRSGQQEAGQALGCVGRALAEPVLGTRGPQLPCPSPPPSVGPHPCRWLPVRDPVPERCWWAQGSQVTGEMQCEVPPDSTGDISAAKLGDQGQRAEGGAGSQPRQGRPAGFSACMLPSCGGLAEKSGAVGHPQAPPAPPGPCPGQGASGPRPQA